MTATLSTHPLSHYAAHPRAIRPVVLMADTNPQFGNILTKSTQAIWRSFVARISLSTPDQAILVKVSNVAKEIGCDLSTVSRAIRTFKKQGWIKPKEGYCWR